MSKDQYYKRFESLFSTPDSITPEPVNGKALPVETEIGPANPIEAGALAALQVRLAELETALAAAQATQLKSDHDQQAIRAALTQRTSDSSTGVQLNAPTLHPLPQQGWPAYLTARPTSRWGYVYDSNELKQLAEGETAINGHGPAIQQTLTVRGEDIGRLAVIESEPKEDAAEIVAAVAERLSAHVDNLRLLVEAEHAWQQSEKRARELEAISQVSAVAATNLDSHHLLQTVVDLTASSLDLYYVQIFLLDAAGQHLVLAAGSGELGQQRLAKGLAIPLDHEHSVIARCARACQGQWVNDRSLEPELTVTLELPDSRSELAVPMIVGHNLVGVFDIHAQAVGHFTAEDLQLKTTLAEQVAIALQNARLCAELKATVAQLGEADQLKSSFLANLSHELRTPLTSILGFAQIILENINGAVDPEIESDVQVIQKNGQHLLGILNDILDMAKINAGQMTLLPEIFDLKEIIEEAAEGVAPLASAKNLTVAIDTSTRPTLNVYADRTRLKQVLLNLLNNAIKFTDAGRIELTAQREEAIIHIEVRDTGQGIAPTDLEKIFTEFTQLDISTTRQVGGTGLGLPISRHLIELHGGKLWAASNGLAGPAGGAKFLIELPVETTYIT